MHDLYNGIKGIALLLYYKMIIFLDLDLFKLISALKIKNSSETVFYIKMHKCSVSRFGDGEFEVMSGSGNGFQSSNNELAHRLIEVISNPIKNHIICIPMPLKSQKELKLAPKLFILGFLATSGRNMVYPFLNKKYQYFDTNFTRFYMPYKKKNNISTYVERLKQIWEKRDICIVEGRYSRLGVNNDLFLNANTIVRIIGPEKNAFDSYDRILEQIKIYGGNRLVLIALGMTATVLAYDLAKEGFQAIDIGHIDVEYMWYKMNAKSKCNIPGRYVNECGGIKEELDESILQTYRSQIVSEVY